jgi:hypothetical protein
VLYSDGGKFIVPIIVLNPVCMMYAAARDPSVMFTEPSEHEWGSVVDSKHTSLFGGSCGSGLDDLVYGR